MLEGRRRAQGAVQGTECIEQVMAAAECMPPLQGTKCSEVPVQLPSACC